MSSVGLESANGANGSDSTHIRHCIDSSDFVRTFTCQSKPLGESGQAEAPWHALLYHSGMSTVGIFALLLIAFFVLHRWYTRPQDDARRHSRASKPDPASRQPPGAHERDPSSGHRGEAASGSAAPAHDSEGGGSGGNGGNGDGGGSGDGD
jgi:hypothetical protein